MTAQGLRSGTPRADSLAHNYHPLPVTVATAEGAWVTDVAGRRYLDLLAGYSALNFGHRHPALVDAAVRQLGRVTLTSRAFDHDLLHPFADALARLVGPLTAGGGPEGRGAMVLPMNTGAEAVETAIKTARKWGYDVRGVPPGEATIVVATGNFHGRTTTIVSFSDDPDALRGFDPYTPGFRTVPYGDVDAVADAVDDTTVAVLMEPVQGESGVVVPPDGFWPALRELTAARDVLLVADEVQSGLGRTGTTLACELWGVRPDLVTLGKALGGGILPVSAVVGRRDVLEVLTPGTHGSTFGGNPLACAVGLAVVDLLATGEPQARARALGETFHARLAALVGAGLLDGARGVGLWAGLDLDPARGTGRDLCEALLARGVLAKDTHGSTIRIAPPLTVSAEDLDLGLSALEDALTWLASPR
ncbi:ornithine--oxo-acid transaminase [Cellulosimicrobium sp. CUA-896]|uniref:ornithine--oxo-acid transaminase n=1 Tax=Cellulosimicrobium sp. CUA-896 TaxID=1517881 RepID=UPI000962A71D|nr:ornithine--oxo-acid transaminase [Cellulosimicrobium sp. CUA-896]OLT48092.1 ornithine--oxo-acid transaminase [Cellulosimicrobium sp. CUA-896]